MSRDSSGRPEHASQLRFACCSRSPGRSNLSTLQRDGTSRLTSSVAARESQHDRLQHSLRWPRNLGPERCCLGRAQSFAGPMCAFSPDGKTSISPNFTTLANRWKAYDYPLLAQSPVIADQLADGLWQLDLESGRGALRNLRRYQRRFRQPFSLPCELQSRRIAHPLSASILQRRWSSRHAHDCDGPRSRKTRPSGAGESESLRLDRQLYS